MGNGSFVEGNNCYLSGTPTGFARMIVKHKTEEKMMPLALFQAQVYKTECTKKSFFYFHFLTTTTSTQVIHIET